MFTSDVYEIGDVVHRGQRSTVVRAKRRVDGALVVIKHPTTSYPSPGELRRLRFEFDVGHRLGESGGLRYIELVPGGTSLGIVMDDVGVESLDQRIGRTLPTILEWLDDAIRLTEPLMALHATGFAHGDVKPANFLVTVDHRLVLCDFGNAVPIDGASRFTSAFGTLAYIAPEQTGRTDRVVDHRADLYSLGATFYHLLVGRRPFESSDPLELLHAHLALRAPPPSAFRADVPPTVDAIVEQLLAKDPTDRYQTAAGLRFDLERCRSEFAAAGAISAFELGARDVSRSLMLSDRVFGRDVQIATLVAAFDTLRPGRARFLFVRGPSGIGKTAIVRQLAPRLFERRAHFCSGKYQELRRHVPYSAVFDAVRSLLREILSMSADRLDAWRRRLLEAVGDNGRLLTDALPELETLLSEQPAVADVSAVEEQARFARVAESFLVSLSSPETPLVLFLDDLQWADDASLRLLESLGVVQSATILVLGAYRDNEIGDGHPLAMTLAGLAKTSAPAYVDVTPLDLEATTDLLRHSFRRSDGTLAELASILHASTGGNPFFLRQLLGSLHRDGLARFDAEVGLWRFDAAKIVERGFTENVVDHMIAELRTFSDAERRVLGVASALGTRFDLDALALASQVSADALEQLLAAPLGRRFLTADDAHESGLRFAHDRIQEAAFELVPVSERERLHLAIGEMLLGAGDVEESLFDLVGHLNAGRSLITDAHRRVELLDLNLRAAATAKASNAWRAASHHLDVARELLARDAPEVDYPRWLRIASDSIEVSYVLGDEERTTREIDAVLANARSVEDRASAYRLRILAYLAQNQLVRAIDTAKDLAALLGVSLPRRAKLHHVVFGLLTTKWRLRGETAETLAARPPMTDPNALVAMEVLAGVVTSTFLAEPDLFPLIAFEMIRLTLTYGIAPASAECLASYAMLVVAALDDVAGAHDLVAAAKLMLDKTGATHRRHRVGLSEGAFVAPWEKPIRASLDILIDSHRLGSEAGDTEYASLAMSAACFHSLIAGDPLDELETMLVRHRDAIRRTNHKHGEDDVRRQLQFVRNLAGGSADPLRMVSEEYDEAEDQRDQLAAGGKNALSALAWYQANLALVFRDLERARDCIDASMKDVEAHRGTILGIRIHFLHAIVHLQLGERAKSKTVLAMLRKRAEAVPSSFGHLADLVEAERARLSGSNESAARLYESALTEARSVAMTFDAAIAAELAARFWVARGVTSIARSYFWQSRHSYRLWGAAAKVAALDAEFGRALTSGQSESMSIVDVTASASETSGHLDLGAAIRASNAVASERTVEGVTRRVLACLLGDAGAERAVLLRVGVHSRLDVVGESTASGDFVALGTPAEDYDGLPERIVRFVHRSFSPVVLRDASSVGEYTQDTYIAARKSKSILCAPVVRQGQLVGIIYLENDLAVGAFSRERLDLVTMLAAQAAVSIANAELYESLERRVRERTDDLEIRNRFIRQTFGRYLSDDIVDSLLETPEGLALGGEKRRVSIVMSDIRGFSTLSERLAPEQVVRLLNNFLSEMTDVILKYQGTIDEFIGDAILTIFGAPLMRNDDADRAVACALAMQQAMVRVNEWNTTMGLPTLEMGIGVNTGEVVVGNIGSQRRAKYGVVGSHVNLASRIESYTVGGQTLVSDSTLKAMRSTVRVDSRLTVHPKGAAEPLTLHEVGAIDGPHAIAIDHVAEVHSPIARAAALEFTELRGKNVGGMARVGRIVGLSTRGAELEIDGVLELLADLRIRFTGEGAPVSEVFAKVVPGRDAQASRVHVRFTSLSEASRIYLESLRDRESDPEPVVTTE